jgi:hypothetical protein
LLASSTGFVVSSTGLLASSTGSGVWSTVLSASPGDKFD